MNSIDLDAPLEQFLAAAPEQTRVLDLLGIDARRDGNRSLRDVCQEQGLEPETVARMLTAFERAGLRAPPATLELMSLTEVCDHVERVHHAHLRDALVRLEILTRAAADRHGAANPTVLTTRKLFVRFHDKITAHLREEAEVLFPLVRQLDADIGKNARAQAQLRSSAARMENEHFEADEALAELRALAASDSATSSIPSLVRTLYALVRLERDVQDQIYIENQVLFPRALAISR